MTSTETHEREALDTDTFFDSADLWAVVLWNDDVTTFDTVIRALVEILGHTVTRADQLAMKVHTTGKAVVGVRPKEEALAAVREFHKRKIQASVDRA